MANVGELARFEPPDMVAVYVGGCLYRPNSSERYGLRMGWVAQAWAFDYDPTDGLG